MISLSRRSVILSAVFSASVMGGACTVGPDYTRPKVAAPDAYRSQAPRDATKTSFGDEPWSDHSNAVRL